MGMNGNDRINRGQWLALAAALLGWMFDGFEMGIFPLVHRPALIEVLGLKEEAATARTTADAGIKKLSEDRIKAETGLWFGRITAAFLAGAALGGWLFGWLGDRVGRVRAMVFSVLTYATFTGLCGLAQDAWHLAALRFVSALGMGGEWSLGVALVMESWPTRFRPLLAGLIGTAANIGFIVTVVPVKAVEYYGLDMNAGGWRWVLGVCAFPALLTFLLRMFVPESEKWQHAVQTGPRPGLAAIFTPQLRWRSLIAAVLGGIALIGTWGSVQWIPGWVQNMTGSQDLANYAQLSTGLGATVGTFCGAVIGHRLGRRLAYCALCLGSLLLCAFLFRWQWPFPTMVSGTDRTWPFFLTIMVVGGFTASFYGWLPLYLPELFPTRVRATGQGFGFNAGRVIAAFGALGAGFLIKDVFGGSYASAGATITLVYLAGMVVIWWAPETRGQPLPE